MSTQTEVPVDEPLIIMTRVYDAPRDLVWRVSTEPAHVVKWWGGPGFSSPECEMDVRPGGRWHHVMRFPDGRLMHLDFVFLEVEPPARLVWEHADRTGRSGGPTSVTTVTLEDLGTQTRWRMVARFDSIAARDAACAMGYSGPIAASTDRLVEYLETL